MNAFRIKSFLMACLCIFLTACGTEETDIEHVEAPAESAEIKEEEPTESVEPTEEPEENAAEETIEEAAPADEASAFQWLYDELNGKSFIFSSGVGAWRTSIAFADNGAFTGIFSDADGPNMVVSEFEGQFEIKEEQDEFTYLLDLKELEVISDTGAEETDGEMHITYVDEPAGFTIGSRAFELYLPYKPKDKVSDEYLSWVYGQANNEREFLNSFGLYNIHEGFGMEEMID